MDTHQATRQLRVQRWVLDDRRDQAGPVARCDESAPAQQSFGQPILLHGFAFRIAVHRDLRYVDHGLYVSLAGRLGEHRGVGQQSAWGDGVAEVRVVDSRYGRSDCVELEQVNDHDLRPRRARQNACLRCGQEPSLDVGRRAGCGPVGAPVVPFVPVTRNVVRKYGLVATSIDAGCTVVDCGQNRQWVRGAGTSPTIPAAKETCSCEVR